MDPRDDRGSTMVEYLLLVAIVSCVTLAASTVLSDTIQSAFSSVKF